MGICISYRLSNPVQTCFVNFQASQSTVSDNGKIYILTHTNHRNKNHVSIFLHPTAFSDTYTCLFFSWSNSYNRKNFQPRCRGNSLCSIKAILEKLNFDIRFIYLIKEYHTHSISNYQREITGVMKSNALKLLIANLLFISTTQVFPHYAL